MSTMAIGPSVPTIRGARSGAAGRARTTPRAAHLTLVQEHVAAELPVAQRPAPALHLTRRGRAVVIVLALLMGAAVFALGARSAAGASSDVTLDRYVVQTGDTLWDIAAESRAAGESVRAQVRELVRVNGLSGDQVVAGEEIVVPRG